MSFCSSKVSTKSVFLETYVSTVSPILHVYYYPTGFTRFATKYLCSCFRWAKTHLISAIHEVSLPVLVLKSNTPKTSLPSLFCRRGRPGGTLPGRLSISTPTQRYKQSHFWRGNGRLHWISPPWSFLPPIWNRTLVLYIPAQSVKARTRDAVGWYCAPWISSGFAYPNTAVAYHTLGITITHPAVVAQTTSSQHYPPAVEFPFLYYTLLALLITDTICMNSKLFFLQRIPSLLDLWSEMERVCWVLRHAKLGKEFSLPR